MHHPHTLSGLSTREAIADVLYRAVIGFDSNDIPIFESAFGGEDVTMIMQLREGGEKTELHGLSKIRALSLDHVGTLDTTHMISNIRIDLGEAGNDATTASLTCYALSQHCPEGRGKEPDGPKYLVGGEYAMDVEKDGASGQWKIKKWVLEVIWRQGDRSIMVPSKKPE